MFHMNQCSITKVENEIGKTPFWQDWKWLCNQFNWLHFYVNKTTRLEYSNVSPHWCNCYWQRFYTRYISNVCSKQESLIRIFYNLHIFCIENPYRSIRIASVKMLFTAKAKFWQVCFSFKIGKWGKLLNKCLKS